MSVTSPKSDSPRSPQQRDVPASTQTIEVDDAVLDDDDDDDDDDPGLGVDAESSTASITSSILHYRTINGRTYHGERGNAAYWGSNDERQSEAMDIAHHMFTLAQDGRLHLAPLEENIQKALDVGCGTGCEVIGTDISPIQPTWVPPNVKFEIEDCNQDWTFPPESFDYVHIRYLVGCVRDWTKLFEEAYKVLKPGGWIESFEASPTIESDDGTVKPDSAMAQWAPIFIEASKKMGNTFTVIADDTQKSGIEHAGFSDIKEWNSKHPLNPFPKDPKLKEIDQFGEIFSTQDTEGFVLFVADTLGWSIEQVQEERSEATAERAAAKHNLDTEGSDVRQDEEGQLREQLKRVEDAESNHDNRMSSSSLANALYLAVRLASRKVSDINKVRNDTRVQEILERVAKKLYNPGVIRFLAGRHELCGLLSTGMLAHKVPVDEDKLKALGENVVKTFVERFKDGRKAHEFESRPMKELLLELERNTKAKTGGYWAAMEEPAPQTLFIPPATDEQISNLEKRLDLTLPDDYKEFLKISNGFRGTWNGYHLDPPLFGADDVDWVSGGFELPFLELHDSISGVIELKLPGDQPEWPDSGKTIKIGSEDILSVLLITPQNTRKILDAYKQAMEGSETPDATKQQVTKVIEARYGSYEEMQKLEWATVESHDSETLPCGTFRHFLEQRLRKTIRGPSPEEREKEAGSVAFSCLAERP
ncbi:hypothetical protein FGRMN_2820 [Fusarium graminum]|nr:hypothetical protein FGRMN_2820 [Fusarium graminum]